MFSGSKIWLPTVAAFRGRYDTIALDLPGFAGSHGEAVPSSIEGFAAAVLEFVRALGLDRVRAIGLSMGGNILLQASLMRPQAFERVVLYGSVCHGRLPRRFETLDQTIERIRKTGVAEAQRIVAASWFMRGEADPYFPLRREAVDCLSTEGAITAFRAVQDWDLRDRLSEIRTRPLLIGGDGDTAASLDELFYQRQHVPGASLAIVPGCSHCVHL
jgi:pimeloyl-ACP methyl ester carboxylesterase